MCAASEQISGQAIFLANEISSFDPNTSASQRKPKSGSRGLIPPGLDLEIHCMYLPEDGGYASRIWSQLKWRQVLSLPNLPTNSAKEGWKARQSAIDPPTPGNGVGWREAHPCVLKRNTMEKYGVWVTR
jgi:hypothetical protein